MSRISLLLVDDHTVIRQGLRALLSVQPDLTILAEAGTGRDAVVLTQKLAPDVVVMDIAMPRLNGLEATRQINRVAPSSKVVVLSAYDKDQYLEPVIAAGAAAYLLKTAAADELADAIHEVHSGGAYFSPEIADRLSRKIPGSWESDDDSDAPVSNLSFRESEVLQLIAEGKTSKEIASELGLSTKTAQNYRRSIMAKLDIHSVVGLVHYAVRHGIIEMHPADGIFNAHQPALKHGIKNDDRGNPEQESFTSDTVRH